MNQPLLFTLAIGMLTIACCIGTMLWVLQRSLRLHHMLEEKEQQVTTSQLRQQEERLQQLLASRQETHTRNEELLRQLSQVQVSQANALGLEQVMESLQPHLLTPAEEEQFRESFHRLYPGALHALRATCPRITRCDELICMLILLKQNNEETARILGISRPSVLQTRYRLRNKLNLPEEADLNTAVRQRMGQ